MSTEIPSPDQRTLAEYLSKLRSGSPTPGGGSATAYAGAMGAALIAMVCRLTKSKDDPALEARLTAYSVLADDCVDRLSECARVDEASYQRFREASSLARATEEERAIRTTMMQKALLGAAEAPMATARIAVEALMLGVEASAVGTMHALSDVRTARHLLLACVSGAIENVNVNIGMIKAPNIAEKLAVDVAGIRDAAENAANQIFSILESRS